MEADEARIAEEISTFWIAREAPYHLIAFEDDKPGVPLAEHFVEIAAKLKEIEVERERHLKELEAKREHEANQET